MRGGWRICGHRRGFRRTPTRGRPCRCIGGQTGRRIFLEVGCGVAHFCTPPSAQRVPHAAGFSALCRGVARQRTVGAEKRQRAGRTVRMTTCKNVRRHDVSATERTDPRASPPVHLAARLRAFLRAPRSAVRPARCLFSAPAVLGHALHERAPKNLQRAGRAARRGARKKARSPSPPAPYTISPPNPRAPIVRGSAAPEVQRARR